MKKAKKKLKKLVKTSRKIKSKKKVKTKKSWDKKVCDQETFKKN
jgi:hypothetical protein